MKRKCMAAVLLLCCIAGCSSERTKVAEKAKAYIENTSRREIATTWPVITRQEGNLYYADAVFVQSGMEKAVKLKITVSGDDVQVECLPDS